MLPHSVGEQVRLSPELQGLCASAHDGSGPRPPTEAASRPRTVCGPKPVRWPFCARLNAITQDTPTGGNVTGVSFTNAELTAKRIGLLHELLPEARRFAALVNPDDQHTVAAVTVDAQAAAMAIGWSIEVLTANSNREIAASFASIAQKRVDALLIGPSPLFVSRRAQIATLAARHALPVIHFARAFVEASGLMSYGSSIADANRLGGIYVGRILKGQKPADLPVQQSVKFELVINLQTAQTLGLEVPPSLLARADEVIE